MNLIKKINRIPLTSFLLFSLIAGMAILLPLSLALIQQQTKLPSSAAPNPTPIKTIQAYGPIPDQPPEIDKINPFVSKAGDVILIEGKNLGQNPKDRKIIFPNAQADENDILKWQPNLVQVRIPKGAKSGLVKLMIGPWQTTWPIPLTIYNYQTKTQLIYQKHYLQITNPDNSKIDTVYIWLDKNDKIATSASSLDLTWLNKLPLAVNLINSAGQIIPFYVNPTQFGF